MQNRVRRQLINDYNKSDCGSFSVNYRDENMVTQSSHSLHKPWLIKLFFISSWSQFVVFLTAITFLSLTPNPGSAFEHMSDKLLHVIGWSSMSVSLGMSWLIAVFFGGRFIHHYSLKKYLLAASFLFVYSIGIEFLQQYTGRQLSGWDMVANSVGVMLGSLLVWVFSRRIDEKRNLRNA